MVTEHVNRNSYAFNTREKKVAFKQNCIEFSQDAIMTFSDMCTDKLLEQTDTCEKKTKKALDKLEKMEEQQQAKSQVEEDSEMADEEEDEENSENKTRRQKATARPHVNTRAKSKGHSNAKRNAKEEHLRVRERNRPPKKYDGGKESGQRQRQGHVHRTTAKTGPDINTFI